MTERGSILDLDDHQKKYYHRKEEEEEEEEVHRSILTTWDRRGFIGRFSRRGLVDNAAAGVSGGGGGGGGGGGDDDDDAMIAFEAATIAEFTVSEGEALYLPAGWAHEVESTGTHMAVTYVRCWWWW